MLLNYAVNAEISPHCWHVQYWLHPVLLMIKCTNRSIKWKDARNSLKQQSRELVFGTCSSHPCEKRKERRRVRSARREREKDKQTPDSEPEALHELQLGCLDSHTASRKLPASPTVSSSSSFRTLLSSESLWAGFLPSSTGTTVKLVGIFSACVCLAPYLCVSHTLTLLLCAGLSCGSKLQLCSYLFDTGLIMWPAFAHIRSHGSSAQWAVLSAHELHLLSSTVAEPPQTQQDTR